MGQGFWEEVIGHQVVPAAVTIETGDRIWRSQRCDSLLLSGLLARESTLWQAEEQPVVDFSFSEGGASNFQSVYSNTQQRKRFEIAALPGRDCRGGG